MREKWSKYGVISGPYFPGFSPNAGKYGPEKTPYLDTFHAYLSVFSPNTGKYGPEITPYLDTFDAVDVISSLFLSLNAFILPATRKKNNEIYTLFVKNTLLFIYSGKKKFHDKFLGTYFVCM